mgnify:CR=1 FL=1
MNKDDIRRFIGRHMVINIDDVGIAFVSDVDILNESDCLVIYYDPDKKPKTAILQSKDGKRNFSIVDDKETLKLAVSWVRQGTEDEEKKESE